MSLDQDFELPDDDLSTDGAGSDGDDGDEDDGPLEPQPLVVIQYRNRGIPPFLFPPLLVLLAAAVIISYQRQTPPRSLAGTVVTAPDRISKPSTDGATAKTTEATPASDRKEEATAPVAEEKPSPPPVDEPVPVAAAEVKPEPVAAPPDVVPAPPPDEDAAKLVPLEPGPRPEALPPPTPTVTEPESAPEPPSPFELGPDGLKKVGDAGESAGGDEAPSALALAEAREPGPAHRPAVGFQVPNGADLLPPEPPQQPEPDVTREQVEQDIRREAEVKAAERDELGVIKSQAKLLELREAIDRANQQRVLFRNELRLILRTAPRDQASAMITDLCDQYGRDALPEIRRRALRALKDIRPGSRESVEILRRLGLPEPTILDYLAHDIHEKTKWIIKARGGPQSVEEFQEDVHVRAAYLLLSVTAATPRNTHPKPGGPAPVAGLNGH